MAVKTTGIARRKRASASFFGTCSADTNGLSRIAANRLLDLSLCMEAPFHCRIASGAWKTPG